MEDLKLFARWVVGTLVVITVLAASFVGLHREFHQYHSGNLYGTQSGIVLWDCGLGWLTSDTQDHRWGPFVEPCYQTDIYQEENKSLYGNGKGDWPITNRYVYMEYCPNGGRDECYIWWYDTTTGRKLDNPPSNADDIIAQTPIPIPPCRTYMESYPCKVQ